MKDGLEVAPGAQDNKRIHEIIPPGRTSDSLTDALRLFPSGDKAS